MAVLIERSAALNALNVCGDLEEAWTNVARLPAVDAVEVRHGRWKMNSNYPDMLICSECDGHFDCWHWEIKEMHFCPNCGADMRDGKEAE